MGWARRELLRHATRISELALKVGFHSLSQFNPSFSPAADRSPSACRKANRCPSPPQSKPTEKLPPACIHDCASPVHDEDPSPTKNRAMHGDRYAIKGRTDEDSIQGVSLALGSRLHYQGGLSNARWTSTLAMHENHPRNSS